ncbi:phage capsid protein [Burkholderia stagnalis]|uniref:Major capsid protein n=1 Tax=Burkholderia stagnalis TaxID=1503054 RepID=A0A119KVG9_9BURK|nr:phage capsid protein [Burkholderia stagnalis]KVO56579.1 hypothetical protein WT18_20310 [Burkholderia stagnalis]KVP13888.1 hypothetical protein WT20_07125 [Burkholderia stagnalis]KVW93854.1 hypothetical protein WT30_18905 [Burkholderia stagnalis]KVZ05915.1 hypothetical protein WT35_24295 [Burkholderia stagnalis]KWA50569.1 hypothetical protein WT43_29160 [Burkholderia stagnalis]
MSNTITNAFVQQWDTTIRLQAQQSESRFGNAVTDRGNITGESFTANRLAPLEDMPENTVRHGDTEWSEADHSTRIALMRDFYQALPVDRNDEPKLLANPLNGTYMQSLIAAHNRRKDKIIFDAAIGVSQSKEGDLIVLPPPQHITAGNTGMTKSKLLTARKIFRAQEADQHNGEELFIAFNSEMLEDVLADTTLTSADFMAVKMLQDGDISGKWLSFNWIPYERLRIDGNTYTTAVWAKSAIHFGTGFTEGKASRRSDKKDLMQVSMAASHGATRVEEEKVVSIDFV